MNNFCIYCYKVRAAFQKVLWDVLFDPCPTRLFYCVCWLMANTLKPNLIKITSFTVGQWSCPDRILISVVLDNMIQLGLWAEHTSCNQIASHGWWCDCDSAGGWYSGRKEVTGFVHDVCFHQFFIFFLGTVLGWTQEKMMLYLFYLHLLLHKVNGETQRVG